MRNSIRALAAAATLAVSGAALAGTTDPVCGNNCTGWVQIGEQTFNVPVQVNNDGTGYVKNFVAENAQGRVTIDSLFMDPDPQILFGIGVLNFSTAPVLYSFGFSIPISLSGTVGANSQISYALTDGQGNGVTLAPFFGNNVLVANDFDATLVGTNKGVDVGQSCSTALCGPYSGSNVLNFGTTQVVMGATVSFLLTGQDAAGLSGYVVQTPIPEPATYLMMGLGVAGLLARRRSFKR